MDEKVKKGQFLGVKAPPYYTREYFYEVTSAGDRVVRARLYGSPKVRKSWSAQEFAMLMEMGVVRLADKSELEGRQE